MRRAKHFKKRSGERAVSYTHLLMQMAENYCYKHSDYVVSLLPCAEGHMKEHGLADGKFVYIPNGIVKEDWEKSPGNPPVYADKLGQYRRDGWFLIGYTGAHGIANGLDSFIEAGKALQGKKIKLKMCIRDRFQCSLSRRKRASFCEIDFRLRREVI